MKLTNSIYSVKLDSSKFFILQALNLNEFDTTTHKIKKNLAEDAEVIEAFRKLSASCYLVFSRGLDKKISFL